MRRVSRKALTIAVVCAFAAGISTAAILTSIQADVARERHNAEVEQDAVVHETEVLAPEEVPQPELSEGVEVGDVLDQHPGPLEGSLRVWPASGGTFLVIDADKDLPDVVVDDVESRLVEAALSTDAYEQAAGIEAVYRDLLAASDLNLVVIYPTPWDDAAFEWSVWSAYMDGDDLFIEEWGANTREAARAYAAQFDSTSFVVELGG